MGQVKYNARTNPFQTTTIQTRTGIDRKELLYEVERLKQERLARKAAREGLTGDKDV